MEQGQINDTLNQVFTDKELGQIISALKNSYFDMKNTKITRTNCILKPPYTRSDENVPGQIRMLRDYEL